MDKIHVRYGQDGKWMAQQLLRDVQAFADLRTDMHVAIKPNLVVEKPASSGATTSVQTVEGMIIALKDFGVSHITVMESSWVGGNTQRSFKIGGYPELEKRYGVKLQDLKKDAYETFSYELGDMKICKSALEADYLINVPVLKGHCQTLLTCALKNMKGCIPDSEKRRFHALDLHTPIAYLNRFCPPHLTLVEAIMGDLTFEEGGTPVEMNRMFIGRDPVMVDSYAASLVGLMPQEVAYIGIAQALGVGRLCDVSQDVVEHNADQSAAPTLQLSGKAAQLAKHVVQKNACSSCFASTLHALNRLGKTPYDQLYVGQGFKGQSCGGLGIGNCCSSFSRYVKGCPPKASDIRAELE